MAEQYAISAADLRTIENNLRTIYNNIDVVNTRVENVNSNVKVVNDSLNALSKDFYDFVLSSQKAGRLQRAETKLIQIRQELNKKYGHYDTVRRTTTGILQADDLGLVKKNTISNATEEMMLSTPGYWLAPCLVALAAWINDQPDIANRALLEGIKRDDEKTSLFFALICRRADRKVSCLKWTRRYLENQDEENLDRKTIIILDAYASGLLGADSEGIIAAQMDQWLANLTEKPGFVEQQTQQWSDAINLKRKSLSSSDYVYLSKYSDTWPVLKDIMEGAELHATILEYFTNIFDQEDSTDALKARLDKILDSLVTDFDNEELPLRKQEKFEQLVVEEQGDEAEANKKMAVEQSAFDTHKDFTKLLTDAAMNPDTSHSSPSTQKFALALSKDWVLNAYNDVTAQNRMKIPNEINITIDSFKDKTTDGQNEGELIQKFNTLIDTEKDQALAANIMTTFEQFCLYGGAVIGLIGLLLFARGSLFLGALAIIVGIVMVVKNISRKKQIEANRQSLENEYEKKRENGAKIIRALLAEVVDFRAEFAEKDAGSQLVIDLLTNISPEQYVKKLSESNRRINVAGAAH